MSRRYEVHWPRLIGRLLLVSALSTIFVVGHRLGNIAMEGVALGMLWGTFVGRSLIGPEPAIERLNDDEDGGPRH